MKLHKYIIVESDIIIQSELPVKGLWSYKMVYYYKNNGIMKTYTHRHG